MNTVRFQVTEVTNYFPENSLGLRSKHREVFKMVVELEIKWMLILPFMTLLLVEDGC